jgi:hypothetical protein
MSEGQGKTLELGLRQFLVPDGSEGGLLCVVEQIRLQLNEFCIVSRPLIARPDCKASA